jgi:hypothetical protein
VHTCAVVLQSAEQIEEVRRAQAEFLFRHNHMEEAAASYAATTVPFEEVRCSNGLCAWTPYLVLLRTAVTMNRWR